MSLERKTLRLRADADEDLTRAAEILRGGGTVAFPTETVYGLGANALDAAAVAEIFKAKERPSWDPLIVHVSDAAMLLQVARLSDEIRVRADRLISAFWPGPLTLLLPRTAAVPDAVTAGRRLVGVRMPGHDAARSLIARAGSPVAAPSANRFGRTSPTTAAHVIQDLDGRIDAVLDGGATSVGVESTVLDVCVWPMMIYRPGAVTREMIAEAAGEVQEFVPKAGEISSGSLPSPGLGLRHYAPRARLVLVSNEGEAFAEVQRQSANARVGVMLPTGWDRGPAAAVFGWGMWSDGALLAQRLFAGLRALDEAGVEVIVCPLPVEGGKMGDAIRDRLNKAARGAGV